MHDACSILWALLCACSPPSASVVTPHVPRPSHSVCRNLLHCARCISVRALYTCQSSSVFERLEHSGGDRMLFSDGPELYAMVEAQQASGRTRSHASSFSSTMSGAASTASGRHSTRSLSTGTDDGSSSPWPNLRSVSAGDGGLRCVCL
jgi:hypothetical protein